MRLAQVVTLLVAATAVCAARPPRNAAAPYLSVASKYCRDGTCSTGAKTGAYSTTPEQKQVLNRISIILTPGGKVTGLQSVGEAWTIQNLEEAMAEINSILDGLPLGFFKGASPMVRGPDMLLDSFFQEMDMPKLHPPKPHLVPVIHHLYRLYRASAKMMIVRDTAIRLLRDYSLTTHVDPVEYPVTKYGIEPLHVRVMLDSTEDLVFLRAALEHGEAELFPYHPRPLPHSVREPFGLAALSMVHHANSEIFVTKTLFVIADAMRQADYGTCERAMQAIEAVERRNILEGKHSPISIGDFRGMFMDEYGADSETWTQLSSLWDSEGSRQHIMKVDTHHLAEDISMTILKSMLGISQQTPPGRERVLDLDEIIIRWPYDARNVWHHLAILKYVRYFHLLAGEIKKQILEEEAHAPDAYSPLRYRLQRSLNQRERFSKRTPFVLAAALTQDINHEIMKAFLELGAWAGLDKHIVLNEINDDYGNTGQMYLDGTATFDNLDKRSELWRSAGYAKNIDRVWKGPTSMSDSWESDWDDGGGWEQFPKRPDLDLPANHATSILEVQGLPSTSEFANFVNLRQPVIFRGAMKDLQVPRSMWSLENMIRQYGDADIHVGLIPYLATFAAAMPGHEDTSSLEYQTTMREYVANFRRSDDSFTPDNNTVPAYLFTSDFANKNPTIYDASQQGLEFLRNLSGIQYVTEGQFFVGEAATGAPVHWHNSAVNFLWYGRKRWVLFDPEEAFYSVKSSLHFFNEDLPDIVNGEGKVFRAADFKLHPLEFVQEAGDIVLLPDYWGHGTLNLETSVGIAFEFHALANKMFQTSADGVVAMNIGMGGEYASLDAFYEKHGTATPSFSKDGIPLARNE
eukprot:INCI15468.1.p1 GENE.INCI15468.1~~INCI15468.1.p1  ORF type:complete len:859 (-),score=137.95 INCI15468.1:123-2699(-)